MRSLIIERIMEYQTCGSTLEQNAMLKWLGYSILKDLNNDVLETALHSASNEDLLVCYDIGCTPQDEWQVMYGFEPEELLA